MHGVPADLPLQAFVGDQITQVCLGRFDIQFHCAGNGGIAVWGRWELRDAAGDLVDGTASQGTEGEQEKRESYRIHRLLDVPITRFGIDPPHSFTLCFANGLALTVWDDDEQHEAFSMHLDERPGRPREDWFI